MLHMVFNLDKWNALPKVYQAIVQQACDAAGVWMLSKYDAVNAPALKRLVAAGTILKPFPVPVMEAAYKAAGEYYAELSGKNELFKRAYASLVAYRSEQYLWWQVGELPYDLFIARMRG